MVGVTCLYLLLLLMMVLSSLLMMILMVMVMLLMLLLLPLLISYSCSLCLVPCCVGVVRPGERFRHVLNFLRCSSLPSFGEAWRYEEIMEGAGVFAIDELKEVRRGEIALSVNRVGFGL